MALGQQNTRTPYSLFGVGILTYDGFADNAAMGRNGIAYRFESNYSFTNPASLSALHYTCFNIAPYLDLGKFKTTTTTQDFSNARFNYIALAVPLKSIRSGFAFGLLPYSDIGYNIVSTQDSGGVPIQNTFIGSGGLSRFNFGIGTEVNKYISLGMNYSYVFGQASEVKGRRYPDSRFMLSYEDKNRLYLRGTRLDFGIQFHSTPIKGLSHVLGVDYTTTTKLKGEQDRTVLTYTEILSTQIVWDTIVHDINKATTLSIPQALNIGYSIGDHEKWQVALGFNKMMWSKYSSVSKENNGFSDDMGYSVGAFICPSPIFDKTLKSNKAARYIKSIRYSAGFHHNDGYINVHGVRISENGLSAGFGFPFYKKIPKVDGKLDIITSRIFVTTEWVRRGTKTNGLIQEDFFRLTLGLNFSDNWFKKRQFN